MNSIPDRQNEQRQLERLAAMRQLYSDAKCKLRIQFTLVFLPAILNLVVFNLLPENFTILGKEPRLYVALLALLFPLADLMLDRSKKLAVNEAAQVQELFDRDIFEIKEDMIMPVLENTELIAKSCIKYQRKDSNLNSLRGWYTVPDEIRLLPVSIARIICQRINVNWGCELHRSYAFTLLSLAILISLSAILFGMNSDYELDKFILYVYVPLFPIAIFVLRQVTEHFEHARRLSGYRTSLVKLWKLVMSEPLNEKALTTETINIQNIIYQNRIKAPLILDSFYWLFKNKQEDESNKSAKTLVNEALDRLAPNKMS